MYVDKIIFIILLLNFVLLLGSEIVDVINAIKGDKEDEDWLDR